MFGGLSNAFGGIIEYQGERPQYMGSQMGSGALVNQQQMPTPYINNPFLVLAKETEQEKLRIMTIMGPHGPIEIDQKIWARLEHEDAWLNKLTGQKVTTQSFIDKSKPQKKGLTMFGELKKDVKCFFTEHKGIIYSIIGLFLLDHFVLEGKLKAKLLDLSHRILGKVENKIDSIGTAPNGQK